MLYYALPLCERATSAMDLPLLVIPIEASCGHRR
jgi:hypothetical protein